MVAPAVYVLDILKELETRIGPLQKSAEAAEKHAVLFEETQEADIILLNYDAQNLRIEIEERMKESEKFTKRNEELKTATKQSEDESKRLKEQLSTIDAELERFQKKLVDASAETEKWEGRRLLSVEKRRNANQQIERVQADLATTKIEKRNFL